MGKRTATEATTSTDNSAKSNDSVNRSEIIRTYHAEHPEAKHAEIATALAAQGYEIKTSLVSSVLSKRASTAKLTAADVFELAATFVRANKGKVADAKVAIEAVGAFVDSIGGSAKATEALDLYESVMAAK